MPNIKLMPISGCPFGREVTGWSGASAGNLLDALHQNGMLLFRDVSDISSQALAERLQMWFPQLNIEPPRSNRPACGGPMTVLGSTRDSDGQFNADYVPAATTGAALRSVDGRWDAPLEQSLTSWIRQKQECTFMEWHTDAMFIPRPTAYAALYCKQPGNSHTGFASATQGLAHLDGDMRELADKAVCIYRPSIIYGNAVLGIPAIGSRSVQLAAMETEFTTEQNGTLESPAHPDDPVVYHRLVQTHPHTGERSLRFSLKSLETIIPDVQKIEEKRDPTEGKRAAWQIMRRATAGDLAYLHEWRKGDLIIWDQRLTMHSRVPYDAEREIREMWRVVFGKDQADEDINEKTPQLNLRLVANPR